MTQLSWQPPPVTKCDECEYSGYDDEHSKAFCERQEYLVGVFWESIDTYQQNKNGITKTCPMWIEQNKEKTS